GQELTASVAQARAALAAAQANRDNVYAGVRAEEVARLASEIEKAKSRLTYAQSQLDRATYLARSDTATQQTVDQTVNDVASAKADVAEAEADHAAAVAGPTKEEREIADSEVEAAPPRSPFSSAASTRPFCARLSTASSRDRRGDRREYPRRAAGAGHRGSRQAVAVLQRAGGFPARHPGGDDCRGGNARHERDEPGARHRD